MGDPSLYTFSSPLEGYESLEPLSHEYSKDGKSLINPPSTSKSPAYNEFVHPITNGIRGGFDIHIYYLQTDAYETKFATELHERIRREFPELRIYKLWDKPIGPHPMAMFEVNVFDPTQFGAFIAWLVVNRGPLSALIHPNTDDEIRDHTQRATWMGTALPLNVRMLREMGRKEQKTHTTNGTRDD
ncbi:hypothetical protein LTR09_001431 [Extremus antarcticus]|uniref:DOPA 4,5-dioxygenase n=1 Tax=Extremus antarcticus TaxID=702011 RepID=A0AAJ0GIW1_9PEZI|nr:hypothetical protein LTR09_001431 [Extremus antarcticus]